jgi:hypothetical protein
MLVYRNQITLSVLGLIPGWLGLSASMFWALDNYGPETEKKRTEKKKKKKK